MSRRSKLIGKLSKISELGNKPKPHYPEIGPRILFFSGGSAIAGLSSCLRQYSHNTIHLLTPFDSGGSSAELRRAFHMPSLGDIRARLLALADPSQPSAAEIQRLFALRLPKRGRKDAHESRLAALIKGEDPLISGLPPRLFDLTRRHLTRFKAEVPAEFKWCGASIGNLILAGCFLEFDRDLEAAVQFYAHALGVQGIVSLVLDDDLHIDAILENGEHLRGQHLLTGKETAPISSPVKSIHLRREERCLNRSECEITSETAELIASAELICFPMGSFYTSVLANLLPRGVAAAIRSNPCHKVFIPNTGWDPEQLGMTLTNLVSRLIASLGRQHGQVVEQQGSAVNLDLVILDQDSEVYPLVTNCDEIEKLGVMCRRFDLLDHDDSRYLAPEKLAALLYSLS